MGKLIKKNLGLLVKALNSPKGRDPAVRDVLNLGKDDGLPSDETIEVEENKDIPVIRLTPTQGVIDLNQSAGFNGGCPDCCRAIFAGTSAASPILACGDPAGQMFVVDGHHRWSGTAVYNLGAKVPADVIVVNPHKALLISQLVIAAEIPGKLPSGEAGKGTSIIGPDRMKERQIYDYLLKAAQEGIRLDTSKDRKTGEFKVGPFLNDAVLEVCREFNYGAPEGVDAKTVDNEEYTKLVCAKIAKNCADLGNKYARPAPEREIMPQFDPDEGGPEFDAIKQNFKSGQINYEKPVAPEK